MENGFDFEQDLLFEEFLDFKKRIDIINLYKSKKVDWFKATVCVDVRVPRYTVFRIILEFIMMRVKQTTIIDRLGLRKCDYDEILNELKSILQVEGCSVVSLRYNRREIVRRFNQYYGLCKAEELKCLDF